MRLRTRPQPRRCRVQLLERRALLAGDLEISEFLAANASGLRDEDGQTSDWIELHTNFKLDAGGEYLGLIRPDGTIADQYQSRYPAQRSDIAYGIGVRADLPLRGFLPEPTPGEPNGEVYQGFVKGVRLSRTGGIYDYAFELRIDATTGEPIGVPGDFNSNGVLDAPDIDDLTAQSAGGQNPPKYDLKSDMLVNEADETVWVKELFGSWIGDANLDKEFNSTDLIDVLAAGTYEVDVDAVWTTGDFNGDGRTNSTDLIAALADGGYELGPPPPAAAAVPEPSSLLLLSLAGLALRRRR